MLLASQPNERENAVANQAAKCGGHPAAYQLACATAGGQACCSSSNRLFVTPS